MNSPIDNFPQTPTQTGSGDVQICVAISPLPTPMSRLLHNTWHCALVAGLKRSEISSDEKSHYFTQAFSVSIFRVSWNERAKAAQTLKSSLEEIEIFNRATIALSSADGVLVTVHGFKTANFYQEFLSPEAIKDALNQMEEMRQKDSEALRLAANLVEELLKSHRPAQAGQEDAAI